MKLNQRLGKLLDQLRKLVKEGDVMALSIEERNRMREESRRKKFDETHKIINNELHKECSICKEWLPSNKDYFYRNKSSGIDGLNPYCKECTKKKSSKWINENLLQYRVNRDKYRDKPESRIKNRIRTERWRERGKLKEWQLNNSETMKIYNDKRKNKKHKISKKEWEDCKNYFNYRCAYCGIPIEEHYVKYRGKTQLGDFHRDHADDEGVNDLSNCIPACKICNVRKNYYSLDEWYNTNNDNYTNKRYLKISKWLENDYKLYIKYDKS
jgi:hypothetical protein